MTRDPETLSRRELLSLARRLSRGGRVPGDREALLAYVGRRIGQGDRRIGQGDRRIDRKDPEDEENLPGLLVDLDPISTPWSLSPVDLPEEERPERRERRERA